MRRVRLLVLSAALALHALSCGDPAPPSNTADTGDDADSGAADVVEDIGALDTEEDTQPIDTGSDLGEVEEAPPLAGVGEPCEEDADCLTEQCADIVPGADEGFCTEFCDEDEDCPRDFDCVLLTASGGDLEEICVPTDLCIDNDEDGYGLGPECLGPDCDDEDPAINPAADEICDTFDNDCDGTPDDNPVDTNDDCSTGFSGICSEGRTVCSEGIIECVSRQVPQDEVCDSADNDCDGAIDENEVGEPIHRDCYDGDAGTLDVGVCRSGVQTCASGGFTACLDQVLPSAELCDGLDNDCDGEVDEDVPVDDYYPDRDNDGYGDADADPVVSCRAVEDHVLNNDDCNDDPDGGGVINPDADELPGDEIDQDCDTREVCFLDDDGDGYHSGATIDSADTTCRDEDEAAATVPGGDCRDDDIAINPGAVELPGDEIDQNCDTIELCYVDADNDGYRIDDTVESPNINCGNDGEAQDFEPGDDCADDDPLVHPDQVEFCDGEDQDCDDELDEEVVTTNFWPDADDDGYGDSTQPATEACAPPEGYTDNNLDCDDTPGTGGAIRPSADEQIGDGVDQDCNTVEICWVDLDGDGFHNGDTIETPNLACDGAGQADNTALPGDCADLLAAINPDAEEIVGDELDQNCDELEECYVDFDNDGYRTDDTVVSLNLQCTNDGEAQNFEPSGDCNDTVSAINPAAAEIPADDVDQNCDTRELCYIDVDGDGFRPGDGTATQVSLDLGCDGAGEGVGTDGVGDCNDSIATVFPGAPEVPGDNVDQSCDGMEMCFVDFDNDGFRPDGTSTQLSDDDDCLDDGEGVATDGVDDCNDTNSAIFPGAADPVGDGVDSDCNGGEVCYLDADNDGFRPGDGSATIASVDADCLDDGEAPAGEPTGDCVDSDPSIHPDATELPDDSTDQNCDGVELCYADADNDGYRPDATATVPSSNLTCTDDGEAVGTDPVGDCSDLDAERNPGEAEVCDNKDNDCNGPIDDNGAGGPLDRSCYSSDASEIGVGVCRAGTQSCSAGVYGSCVGQVTPSLEICDSEDNDCDGDEDEDTTTQMWYPDRDGDGYGDPAGPAVESCAPVADHALQNNDCDDDPATGGDINPGVAEVVGDGIDQNCDLQELCYVDLDGDDYHSGDVIPSTNFACDDDGEADGLTPGGDCEDGVFDINPGATEIAGDEIDQDCDTVELCYVDFDNDGYRTDDTVNSLNIDCGNAGEAQDFEPAGDCVDTNSLIFPGAVEGVADGIDQNCDDRELCYVDADGDGFRPGDGSLTVDSPDLLCDASGEADGSAGINDCNDGVITIYPSAPEVPGDEIDQSCDGSEVCFVDADNDGYRPDAASTVPSADISCTGDGEARAAEPTGDCNDGMPLINPGVVDATGDGVDSDCSGDELCYADADGDGYRPGDGSATEPSTDTDCDDFGEALGTAPTGDCMDTNPDVNPGEAELVDDGVDSDCDGFELCYEDVDNDGYRPDATTTVDSPDLTCTEDGEAESTDPTGDCNDNQPLSSPGLSEVCDNIDNDCNGPVDDDGAGGALARSCFEDDSELIGVGLCRAGTQTCSAGIYGTCTGQVLPANEVCDTEDNDCDTVVDEDTATQDWYVDADNDGYGDPGSSPISSCAPIAGRAPNSLDCDDSVATGAGAFPGNSEIVGDGIDQNCDTLELCWVDGDEDGYHNNVSLPSSNFACDGARQGDDSMLGGDCNDSSSAISPGVAEIAGDEFDQNCDGQELCYADDDNDGYRPGDGSATVVSANLSCQNDGEAQNFEPINDCADADPTRNPGAIEGIDDGVDQNCDGNELCYLDNDNDGYRPGAGIATVVSTNAVCTDDREAQVGEPTGDCNDSDNTIFPTAIEGVGDNVDQNCDGGEVC